MHLRLDSLTRTNSLVLNDGFIFVGRLLPFLESFDNPSGTRLSTAPEERPQNDLIIIIIIKGRPLATRDQLSAARRRTPHR